MAHEFEEFHEELRSVAGDLLAKDRTVEWPVLADAGWTGLEVADHFGGSGATFGEVAIVCEEIGRAASATNYLGSGVLAAGLLCRHAGGDRGLPLTRRCRSRSRRGGPAGCFRGGRDGEVIHL